MARGIVSFKDNFNVLDRHIKDVADMLDPDSYFAMHDVMKWICNKMKEDILSKSSEWREQYSSLDAIDDIGTDIEYEIKDNVATIYIGRNTKPIEMKDGRTVNPYYFIEFGWGIRGEESPVNYHSQNGWEYNINGHIHAWWYVGSNGEPRASYGRTGIDFLYRAMQKLKPELEDALAKKFKKRWYST